MHDCIRSAPGCFGSPAPVWFSALFPEVPHLRSRFARRRCGFDWSGDRQSGGPASLKKKGRRSPHASKKRERRYNPSRQVLRTLHGNCPYASKKRGRRYNRLRSAFGALHGELPLRPSRSPAQRQGHDSGFRQISRRAKPDAIAPVRSLPQTERFVLTFNNILLQR